MLTFRPQELHAAATAIFRAAGADEENARIVVDHLIDANLAGHDSHGVIRIPSYVRSIKQGQLDPSARPAVVRETAAMTLIDARGTFGQVSALYATNAAVKKAREHGVAVAGTFNGNHIGRVGYYPTQAAAEGVALLVAYGTLGRSGAPFGGRAGALGTNPISFGFPSGRAGQGQGGRAGQGPAGRAGQGPASGDTPFLLDFATTSIAAGKVMVARDKHEQLPPNSAIDKDGRPTTDPHALSQGGALLPFGGHKGYALSLMAVLLSNVLVRGDEAGGGSAGEGVPGRAKVFFCAIDTGVFGQGAAEGAAAIFEHVRGIPPAEGFERVMIPGEPEAQSAGRRAEAIPVAEDTWKAITTTATELGVAV